MNFRKSAEEKEAFYALFCGIIQKMIHGGSYGNRKKDILIPDCL